jgi:hypothetical protein
MVRIIGILDIFRHTLFLRRQKNAMIRKSDLFQPSVERVGDRRVVHWLLLVISNGPNRVGVSQPLS